MKSEIMMYGVTENYIRVAATYDPLLINETKKLVLTGINEKGCVEVEEAESLELKVKSLKFKA